MKKIISVGSAISATGLIVLMTYRGIQKRRGY